MVDIVFIILNLTIIFDIYSIMANFEPDNVNILDDKTPQKLIFSDTIAEFEERASRIRQIEVFGEIFIVMKSV